MWLLVLPFPDSHEPSSDTGFQPQNYTMKSFTFISSFAFSQSSFFFFLIKSLLGPRGPSSVSCPASSPLQPRMGHAEPRLTYCASPSLSAQQEQQCFPNPGCTVKSSAHEHLHPIIPHTRSAVVHSAATRHRGHCCKRKVAVISKIFLQPAFSLL